VLKSPIILHFVLGVSLFWLLYTKTDKMKRFTENEFTYVLFGKEAVELYNVSLKLLLSSTTYVDYKVGAYKDVKRFMQEQKKWSEFIEIPESDYLHLKKHGFKSPLLEDTFRKKRKRFSILDLFK
jgi:hypothetical protein